MTTYNTGNPVGSTDPRDLYDNAENYDLLSVGPAESYPDRLGVQRKSYKGIENQLTTFINDAEAQIDGFVSDADTQLTTFISSSENGFYNFLVASGFESEILVYTDGTPLIVDRPTQLIQRASALGFLYSVKLPQTFPLALTGSWGADSPLLVVRTDRGTRTDLRNYGAVGDGAVNDTAAFDALEVAIKGETIDLGGRSYAVNPVPTKNTYINGKFVNAGAIRPALLNQGFTIPFGRYKSYGSQLELLKTSLCNPFEQLTGIAFLGDSITWGATLPENISPGSDLTTLATRRDNFTSPSFVNEFKRYIGKEYFDGVAPVISNWAASSAGEAIATYTKNLLLFPNRSPFTFVASGTATLTDQVEAGSVTGYRALLAVSAGSNTGTISMPNFTGEAFNMVFTPVTSDAGSYELIVDGVSQGTFSTVPNGTTIIDGAFGTRINHTFDYVRNKTVQIVLSGVGEPSIRRLRIEAFEIPKTCRITNQGISGSNSTRYRSRALTTEFLPDIAVTAKDNFAFVQLGTNDRLDATWPNGVNSFEKQMADLFDILDPLCNSIVMVANHVSASNQGTRPITMQQIRGSLNRLAKARSYDFIDNYAVFTWVDPATSLADGLHPNALGHQMIYRNIVEALERA